ncbi:MAG TPA: enoyl-CoA hydratase-related protein [Terriglobales bacterium]|nr:enoyl-CoA hydratase-related protein [Terriglobales bacterium]
MADTLRIARDGGVARVTLDRPPLNLLEPGLIRALRDAFRTLADDRTVRVAILSGHGRAFTAGMDVNVLAGLDVESGKRLITSLHEAIQAVHAAPFPVVAAVNGHALGAGFELMLACDLRIAARGGTYGLPEVRVGVPSVIEAALLAPTIGPGRAAELLLCGEAIGADDALAWGLVNRVVDPAGLPAAVDAIVGKILAGAPAAIRLQKELMIRWRSTDLVTAVEYGVNAFAVSYASADAKEGLRAFLEKRPPRWPAP